MIARARRATWWVALAALTLSWQPGCAPVQGAADPDGADPAPRVLVAVRDDESPAEPPSALVLAAAALPSAQPAARPATLPAPSPSPSSSPLALPPSIDLPILMYHHVQDVPASSTDLILKGLSVPPRAFREQVEMLKKLGVQTVSMDDVLDYFYARKPIPPRAVVLTFDDGYADTYTQAYPILGAAGMQGTVYVITDLVGARGYVTWDQLRELDRQGWSVQSHSITHPDLRVVSSAELQRQLRDSRAQIERELRRPVYHLNYPAGMYNQRVVDAAAIAGYRTAVTVNYGTRLTLRLLLELPRVRVNGQDDAATLRARMLPAGWR